MSCPYGPAAQTRIEQYPCSGGCGCWMLAPGMCLGCWLPAQTYEPAQVRGLPDDDPRRARVRDPIDRRRERPTFGRVR